MFLNSNRLERGWKVLEWETLHFCSSHLRGKDKMCKFSLCRETKILIMLNIINSEDFQVSLLLEDFLEDLVF